MLGNEEKLSLITELKPKELREIMLAAVMDAYTLENKCQTVTVLESNDQTTKNRINFSKTRLKNLVSSTMSMDR